MSSFWRHTKPNDISPYSNYIFRVQVGKKCLLEGMFGLWGFWVRLFGYGVAIKRQRLFSERHRIKERCIYIGNWMIERLLPYNV